MMDRIRFEIFLSISVRDRSFRVGFAVDRAPGACALSLSSREGSTKERDYAGGGGGGGGKEFRARGEKKRVSKCCVEMACRVGGHHLSG